MVNTVTERGTARAPIRAIRAWARHNSARATDATLAAGLAVFTVIAFWAPLIIPENRGVAVLVGGGSAAYFAAKAAFPRVFARFSRGE